MSFSLNLKFETYDELCEFITTFKAYKEKQHKRKEKEFLDTYSNLNEIREDKEDKNDRRGAHQVVYHNLAQQYHQQHPELSYRDCLKHVYKNNKVIEKTI